MTDAVDLPRHPALRVVELEGKGRGVVAVEPIRQGELLEAAAVLPLAPEHSPAEDSPIYPYTFAWDEPPFIEAIALGLMTLVNHAPEPSARVERDLPSRTIRLLAARDIAAGEEITFDYGIPLWFEPSP